MLSKRDGPGAIRVVVIATFQIAPGAIGLLSIAYCFFNGVIAMCVLFVLFTMVFIFMCLTLSIIITVQANVS